MGESRIPSVGGTVAIAGAIGATLAWGAVAFERTGDGHMFSGREPAIQSVAASVLGLTLTTAAAAQPAELPNVPVGDPTPLVPPAMTNAAPPTPDGPRTAAAPAATPPQPPRKTPVAAKHEPPAHGPQGRPLIPPAVVAIPLSPPPLPRPPLSIETDLLPVGAAPPAAAPAKPPAS